MNARSFRLKLSAQTAGDHSDCAMSDVSSHLSGFLVYYVPIPSSRGGDELMEKR